MKYISVLIFVSIFYCGPSQKTKELMEKANTIIGKIPGKMPGGELDTKELVELGKSLYFEKRLSKNNTQSCNSCHFVGKNQNGVDNLPNSVGVFGKNGDRNAPTTFNAGFHISQFWDGRSVNLKEQAKGPILNPIEMAMSSEKEVIEKLKSIQEYKSLFEKAYPNVKDPISYDNLANAIAAFERTLITNDRLNEFISGDYKALTEEEQKGLETFLNYGCISCHNGSLLGGQMFQKMGMINPYSNTTDLGRYNVTKNEFDKFVFKVPSLRNISNTQPYFHDGKVGTLEEAVKLMAWMQLGRKISEEDLNSIVVFLKSLSKTN